MLLSLDTSTKKTGYALWHKGKLKKYGLIDISHDKDISSREKKMILSIYDVISKFKPDTVVAEITAVARNVQTQRVLTLLLGAVYGKCVTDNIEFVMLRPSEWRSLVDKNPKPKTRDELKAWGISKCKELFDLDLDSDDISDAILIGFGYHRRNTE